jgi:hypothetical protein
MIVIDGWLWIISTRPPSGGDSCQKLHLLSIKKERSRANPTFAREVLAPFERLLPWPESLNFSNPRCPELAKNPLDCGSQRRIDVQVTPLVKGLFFSRQRTDFRNGFFQGLTVLLFLIATAQIRFLNLRWLKRT